MRIWLLNIEKNKKIYDTKRFLEEGRNMGLKIKFVAVEKVELVLSGTGKSSLFIDNKPVKLPDVVVPRNSTGYQIKCITDFLSRKGVHVINSNDARFLAKDKFFSLQKLSAHHLPIPKTVLLKGIPDGEFVAEQFSYPLVIKKIEGSYGKGILLVKNQEELEDIMEMLSDSFNKLNINLLLQEYIGEKPGSDLRLFVVGGKVIASMLRKGKKGDFKANYSGGGSAYEHKPTKEEKEIAIQAAKIIGLDIAGVDLLFDKDNGYRICEINGSPGFEGLEQATGKNIAESIMKYIASKKKGK